MPRKRKPEKTISEAAIPRPPVSIWLRADYLTHTFHYRMPETVAVAAINPFVPSPLTVKMALVASFFREGDQNKAERMAKLLPFLEVKIKPPDGAIAFRAFMRYARPPKAGGKPQLKETGAIYVINPHMREYVIWSSPLSVYVGICQEDPKESVPLISEALQKISYLGCKDSLVTCLSVSQVSPDENECLKKLEGKEWETFHEGFVVRLADLIGQPQLKNLIPTQRKESDYKQFLFLIPRRLKAEGKVKIMHR